MVSYVVVAIVASLVGYCVGALMASSKFHGMEMRMLHLVLSIYRFAEKYKQSDSHQPPDSQPPESQLPEIVEVSTKDIRTLREIAEEAE